MEWNIVFSGFVAIATVVYAILTWKLVSETRKMRVSQFMPHISIIFEPREEWINFIDLKIKNNGLGSAHNIKFKLLSNLNYKDGERLSEMNLMKNGLKYLAPNQEIKFFYTSLAENYDSKKEPIKIKVFYKDILGKIHKELFIMDFTELMGRTQLGEPPIYKIAKNIEHIQKDINHLSTGFHKLKTIIYTKKDIQEEHNKHMKAIEKVKKRVKKAQKKEKSK